MIGGGRASLALQRAKGRGSPTKQLIECGAKGERYERHRQRHWVWSDPRQLKLPFNDGTGNDACQAFILFWEPHKG